MYDDLNDIVDELEEENQRLEDRISDLEEELDAERREYNFLQEYANELEDKLFNYESCNAIRDLKHFIDYMKDENLYTDEFEKFLDYYMTCHN